MRRSGRAPLRATLAAVVLLGGACGRPAPADPAMVSEWIHTLYGLVRSERLSPPVASRLLAYASVALYEGLALADPGLRSHAEALAGLGGLPRPDDPRELDATVVAVTATRTVLAALFREGLATTHATLARLADSLAATRDLPGPRRQASEEAGRRLGERLLAWAEADRFAETRTMPWTPPTGPGTWINDAPPTIYATQNLSGASQAVGLDDPAVALRAGQASDRALVLSRPKPGDLRELRAANMAGATEPHWGRIRPLVLSTWDECPVAEPPRYQTDVGSPLYQEALAVAAIRDSLTPDQRAIALYWADNAGESGTPPGHWSAIASQLAGQRGLTASRAALVFMASALAQADALIATWGYKYAYNYIRPRTYIRRVMDPAWEPAIPTPPFPEYPSGHSAQSAAAATVLAAVLGDAPFDDSTGLALGHPVRRFGSFREAALEVGWSRVLGGIHFPVGNTGGRDLGTCIGQRIIERLGLEARR